MIKFESENHFEKAFFRYMDDNRVNPLTGMPVTYAATQVDMGEHGRADVLIIEEFSGRKGLHIVELKITSLTFPDIGQICRYKDFVEKSGLMESLGAQYANYSLVTHPSQSTPSMSCIARAAGIDLLYYEMSFDGVQFDSHDEFEPCEDRMSSAAIAIVNRVNPKETEKEGC